MNPGKPCCHSLFAGAAPKKFCSSESALCLRILDDVVIVVDFLIAGFRVLSCWPECWSLDLSVGLLHGIAEAERVNSRADFISGRRVAIQPAAMPTPTSTVDQMAKSVVR